MVFDLTPLKAQVKNALDILMKDNITRVDEEELYIRLGNFRTLWFLPDYCRFRDAYSRLVGLVKEGTTNTSKVNISKVHIDFQRYGIYLCNIALSKHYDRNTLTNNANAMINLIDLVEEHQVEVDKSFARQGRKNH